MAGETREHAHCQGGVMVVSHVGEAGVEWTCLHCGEKESGPAQEPAREESQGESWG